LELQFKYHEGVTGIEQLLTFRANGEDHYYANGTVDGFVLFLVTDFVEFRRQIEAPGWRESTGLQGCYRVFVISPLRLFHNGMWDSRVKPVPVASVGRAPKVVDINIPGLQVCEVTSAAGGEIVDQERLDSALSILDQEKLQAAKENFCVGEKMLTPLTASSKLEVTKATAGTQIAAYLRALEAGRQRRRGREPTDAAQDAVSTKLQLSKMLDALYGPYGLLPRLAESMDDDDPRCASSTSRASCAPSLHSRPRHRCPVARWPSPQARRRHHRRAASSQRCDYLSLA
jgi:hypothetical protein